jgi:zinc protease
VDLLSDAIFHSTFDEGEFEREKQVILEEISRGEDHPSRKVGQKVFSMAYEGSEAGRPIIGSVESVSGFKRDELVGFYNEWYQPQNLRLVIVGDVNGAELLPTVRKLFGERASKPTPPQPVIKRTWPKDLPVALIKGDYKQPRLEVVYPGPDLESIDTVALDLASFALGSGELSRFNRRLRDKEQVVTTVGCSLYSPHFGGIFEFSAFTTEDKILAAAEGFGREAVKLKNGEPVSADELSRARANLRSEKLYRDETVEGQARSIGFGLRTGHGLLFDEVYATQTNHIADATVSQAVNRWMDLDHPLFVLLLPEDSTISEEQVRQAYRQGIQTKIELGAQARAKRHEGEVATSVVDLKPGLKLVYRHNPEAHLFALTAVSEGGLRAEDVDSIGSYNAMSGLLACATKTKTYPQMMGLIEGLGANFEGFSGKDSFGFNASFLTEQFDQMLEALVENFMDPVFPEEQWQTMRAEIQQAIISQNDSPSNMCIRKFQELMFGDHPYRSPIYGSAESVEAFTAKNLLEFYHKVRDEGPWVIAACGSLSPQDVEVRIKAAFSEFNPKPARRTFKSDDLLGVPAAQEVFLEKDREQAHILYGFKGITWDDPDRAALDVMVNILGGHGGRLFMNLRDRDSLAYTVSPISTYGRHPGLIGSYIACSPSKVEQAVAGLKREMHLLAEVEPSQQELDRSVAHIIGTHDMGLQRSHSQASTMALMEVYGYGYDDFLTYPKKLHGVTVKDVKKIAQRLFDRSHALMVTVGPKGSP